MEKLLTVPEAARRLGVATREVYAMIDRGELAAVNPSGRIMVPADQVAVRVTPPGPATPR